jgi:hypothetical protein
LEAKFSEEQWREVSSILESYLLRRAICGLPTKNYNRIFLNMTRFLAREGGSPEAIFVYLSDLAGESTAWPSDDEFREAWITKHTFQTLAFSKRIVHIFLRLNATYISTMVEEITINSPMTVEHILPKNWLEKWPLPDGTKGLDSLQLWDSSEDDERAVATRRRNAALETLGNLTIMVQPLNSTLSNGAWREKKPEFLNSLLPINQKLALLETWDEEAIAKRSGELFERAVRIWPGPGKRRA